MKNVQCLKEIGYYVICLLSAVFLGTILMIAVYCLPINKMRENVKKSISIYELEGEAYYWGPKISSTRLDNFTDSIILNNAVFWGTDSVIKDAMNNPYMHYVDQGPITLSLSRAVSEDFIDPTAVRYYARYWHGYLVWLKPLLLVMTVSDIRLLCMWIQFVLLFFVLGEVNKRCGKYIMISFFVVMMCLNPISTILSMQLACVYVIMLFFALYLLRSNVYSSTQYGHMFLWMGIATAYFDFLTYPLVGLGINLCLLITLSNDSLKKNMQKIVCSTLSWGIGYAGMWSGKWLVSWMLTGNNTIQDGISVVKTRMSGDTMLELGVDKGTVRDVIGMNIKNFLNLPVIIVLILLLLVSVFLICSNKRKLILNWGKVVPLCLVGCYPLGWYAVIKQHSAVHAWMTWRNLVITFFAFVLIFLNSMITENKQKTK